MQIIKPLFAFFCAQLALASPLGAPEEPSVEIAARDPPAPSAELKKWNAQSGVPGGALAEGLHIFKAGWPRDVTKDIDSPDIVKEARNFLNANHYVLISVEVKQKTTGPPKKRVTTLDVGDVKFFDVSIDANNKVHNYKEGATYGIDRAIQDGVHHTYIKKLGSRVKSFTQITPVAQQFVRDHPDYNAQTNNCMTFVDDVANELR
ncbi:hypothetical protein GGR52DRAFT_573717 [Hypoxylon sp. FL1284]|nr:hypothetical protein GGR52DRAFT_573717 [Hypoxylon sp. FL1284]